MLALWSRLPSPLLSLREEVWVKAGCQHSPCPWGTWAPADRGHRRTVLPPCGPAPAYHPLLLPLIQRQQRRVAGGSLRVGPGDTGFWPCPWGLLNSCVIDNIWYGYTILQLHN